MRTRAIEKLYSPLGIVLVHELECTILGGSRVWEYEERYEESVGRQGHSSRERAEAGADQGHGVGICGRLERSVEIELLLEKGVCGTKKKASGEEWKIKSQGGEGLAFKGYVSASLGRRTGPRGASGRSGRGQKGQDSFERRLSITLSFR